MKILSTPFRYNDGGREEAGFKGYAGDCVVRAIAIASEKNYMDIYNDLKNETKMYVDTHRDKIARKNKGKNHSPRDGVYKKIYHNYLLRNGWEWIPTMFIGSGCKVHLCKEELPEGKLIVSVSKHLTCVINGVINDTFNPARGATRCVYGYWILK